MMKTVMVTCLVWSES